MINENIAYAKSILNKNGITIDSQEYEDYLKIREICGVNTGYVGILTKIRFNDNITDFSEIKSIFDILKNSKIDINKLNKMNYNEILELFYNEFDTKEKDYELIYKDKSYSYYRVYTYEGILKIGSPAWCIKTKSKWDEYQSIYNQQWVVIDNNYKNKLITPNNNYLAEYKPKYGWTRFGISLKLESGDQIKWVAFNDGNSKMEYSASDHTFFGVFNTLLNLLGNVKKSYYENFPGCEISRSLLKIIDVDSFSERSKIDKKFLSGSELYIKMPEEYDHIPLIMQLDDALPHVLLPCKKEDIGKHEKISGPDAKGMINDYAIKSNNELYYGLKLQLGQITMDEIESNKKFVKKIGKWIVFNRNKDYYLIVNTECKETYNFPLVTFTQIDFNIDNPFYWYIVKNKMTPYNDKKIKDYHKEVIDALKDSNYGKIKKFWNFKK